MVRNRVVRDFKDVRFFYMMVSLFMFIWISPFIGTAEHFDNVIRSLFISFILFSGVYGFWRDRRHIFRVGALAMPFLLFIWLRAFVGLPFFSYATPLLGVVFYAYVTYLIFASILRNDKITNETLYAVVCVYLLLGILFASVYMLVYQLIPDSFLDASVNDFMYFSFVTLTTVGYGEIVPVSPVARSFAMIESILGVLYTTIIIARIVGLYIRDMVAEKQNK